MSFKVDYQRNVDLIIILFFYLAVFTLKITFKLITMMISVKNKYQMKSLWNRCKGKKHWNRKKSWDKLKLWWHSTSFNGQLTKHLHIWKQNSRPTTLEKKQMFWVYKTKQIINLFQIQKHHNKSAKRKIHSKNEIDSLLLCLAG